MAEAGTVSSTKEVFESIRVELSLDDALELSSLFDSVSNFKGLTERMTKVELVLDAAIEQVLDMRESNELIILEGEDNE